VTAGGPEILGLFEPHGDPEANLILLEDRAGHPIRVGLSVTLSPFHPFYPLRIRAEALY
jgi:hypothetical protein